MRTTTVTAPDAKAADGAEKQGGGSRRKLVVVVLLVAMAAAYWFLMKPSASADAEPVPGAMMAMEAPIQINLAGGHYLKVGVAVQMTDHAEEADPSKAVDALISTFSDQEMAEVSAPAQREKMRGELLETLQERYDGEVMEVFFTDFVTQ